MQKSALAVRRERAAAACAAAVPERVEEAAAAPATPEPRRKAKKKRTDEPKKGEAREAPRTPRETPRKDEARKDEAPRTPHDVPRTPSTPTHAETVQYVPPRLYAPDYKGSHKNCVRSDGTLLCGLRDEALLVRGQCTIHVEEGRVHAAGAVLTPDTPPLVAYVPSVHPALELIADAAVGTHAALPGFAAVVRLTPLSTGIEHVARVCPVAGPDPFAELWIVTDAAQDAVRTPDEWAPALDALTDADDCIALVRGAKNTGKSTFAHLALHHLLRTHRFVAFLDLDVGQPEFGPPGFVSLHIFDASAEAGVVGPAWALPRIAVRAHFYGDVSPREDPARYAAYVADLAEFFRTELHYYRDDRAVLGHMHSDAPARPKQERRMPLVVNTHGWNKGLGADLVHQAAERLQPTHVFELDSREAGALAAFGDTPCGRHAAQARRRRINAAEARTLATLSYLHATHLATPGGALLGRWDFFTPLVAQRPWVVDVAEGLPGGLEVHVDPSLALHALNGALVGLVARTPGEAPDGDVWHAALQRGAQPAVHALGLALVRGVDRDRGVLHLLTPLAPALLATRLEASCAALGVVHSALELPIWASLDAAAYADVLQQRDADPVPMLAGMARADVPYLAFPTELLASDAIGARPRKVRRNLMRRAQIPS